MNVKKIKSNIGKIVLFFSVCMPAITFAAAGSGLKGLLVSFGNLVKLLIPITAGCALLFFFWGVAQFILKAGSEDGQEEGKEIMKWGIVALFVMVSIWGIVGYIQSDLGIPDIHNISAPGIR